ncbi:CBS domain-containing protein [Aggregicoccus sp. 17bor-14]|uniref:CBS domain-containing protein n=1 Tax=Myxococcaceae TaxID=31 RepID=UPI00129C638F|nr:MULTISPECIES: CBS domain-containing protein [Myxococcaceae]MBF5042742.1 CBS domain-containing protein [Simulacricoccus sp. 17bor-14]MRI88510.1 CBS domain-containing protein [Aggregicoccus sp. 17bor-14]
MAWRDNGNGNERDLQRRGVAPERQGEVPRAPELTPPGSAERSRSDLTGYRQDRDEEPEARQGRFHRAASLRLLTPTLSYEPRPPEGRAAELERWGGGWHGEQPWEPDPNRAGRDRAELRERSPSPGRLDEGGDFYASAPTRAGFATAFAGRERVERMAAEEARLVEQLRRGGRGGSEAPGHAFTSGSRGLREEGSVPRRWQREPLTAQEVMTRSPRTVSRDSSLQEAARLMRDENVGVVPVVDPGGRLLGLVTDRDLVVRAFTDQRSPEQFRVKEVMTDDVHAVTPETSLVEVIELMGRHQVRRVPVVDREDRLLGIIAMADVANRADQDEELQQALERISSRRSFWSRF